MNGSVRFYRIIFPEKEGCNVSEKGPAASPKSQKKGGETDERTGRKAGSHMLLKTNSKEKNRGKGPLPDTSREEESHAGPTICFVKNQASTPTNRSAKRKVERELEKGNDKVAGLLPKKSQGQRSRTR